MRLMPLVLAAALALLIPASSQAQRVSPAGVIRNVFGQTAQTATCFAYRESRLYPRATHYNYGGTVDRGLFQINSSWVGHTVQWYTRGHGVRITIKADLLYRARYNARVAWAISRGGTYWQAWGWNC